MNILFLDLETTGLNKDKNEIIQIAGLVVVDEEIKKEFQFFFKPTRLDYVEESALIATKLTLNEIMAYNDDHQEAMNIIDGYLKEFNTTNRHWYLAGQNSRFDYDFLRLWWEKHQTTKAKRFKDLFRFMHLDLINIAFVFKMAGIHDFPDFKLQTIVDTLGLTFDGKSHDALNDIKMTYRCYLKLVNELKEIKH